MVRNKGFVSETGSKMGKRNIDAEATKAAICLLLTADMSRVIPVMLSAHVNAKAIWYLSSVPQVMLNGIDPSTYDAGANKILQSSPAFP